MSHWKQARWPFVVFVLIEVVIFGSGSAVTKFAYDSITPLWCLAVQCGFQFHSAAPLLCAGRPLGARFKLVKFGCLCKTAQGQRLRCPWAASPVLLYAPP